MRGKVLSIDATTGSGSIVGADGARYRFDRDSAPAGELFNEKDVVEFTVGQGYEVEFGSLSHLAVPEVDAVVPRGRLDIGRTIQRTFGSIARNWAVFLTSAGLLVGAPGLAGAFGLDMVSGGTGGLAYPGGPYLGWAAIWLLSLIGSYLLQVIVVQTSVSGFGGGRMGLRQAFAASVPALLPLIGASLVVGIATGLGFVLLIVPGVVLSVIWIVVAPVIIVERRSIDGSLRRSMDLTKGSGWQIFGLLVIYCAGWLAIGLLEEGIRTALLGSVDWTTGVLLPLVVSAAFSAVGGLVAAAGTAAIYFELRELKDGVGAEQLAAIFD